MLAETYGVEELRTACSTTICRTSLTGGAFGHALAVHQEHCFQALQLLLSAADECVAPGDSLCAWLDLAAEFNLTHAIAHCLAFVRQGHFHGIIRRAADL